MFLRAALGIPPFAGMLMSLLPNARSFINKIVYNRVSEPQRIQALVDIEGSDFPNRKGLAPESLFEWQTVCSPDAHTDLKTGTVEGIKKQLGLK